MPQTPKGKKIERKMIKQYGPKKGARVYHASAAKGTIKGVEKKKHGRKK